MKLKPVAYLLGLALTSPALAIGLGDLSVRSFLGQPLHVTVEVLSPPANLDADCFSVRPGDSNLALPVRARFAIERSGGNALLHITTPQAFNEPIAQFVLAADCEGRLQREYVLLLDPPLQVEAVSEPEADPAPSVRSMPLAAAAAPGISTAVPAATDAPAATPKRSHSGKPRRSAPPKPVARTETPRLVISGKKSPSGLPAGPETVPTAPANPLSDLPTVTELSDENTALQHKLAHIESQLVALQQRNAELEARLDAESRAIPEPTPRLAPEWPVFSLGLIGLLAGSGALVSWMRRRSRPPQTTLMEQTLWTSLKPIKPVTAQPVAGPLPSLSAALPRNDSQLAPMPPARARTPDIEEFPLTAVSDGTEVKEDVLDQAEVFVLHGYPNLAVHLLREHLRTAPAESPAPWLLLLDLLHREKDEAGYAEASAECRRHFNVNFPDRPAAASPDDGDGLLAHPHILEMLTRAWNTPGVDAIFQDLIYDRRGGVRVGFEPGAYQDILLLRAIAKDKLPLAA